MTRIEKVVTSGTFSLDGGTWEVDNNVWLLGDDDEVLVVDAAHDADAIAAAVGDRRVTAIVCTHAHNDHVNAAPALAARTGAPILLHPDDEVLWNLAHPGAHAEARPDGPLADGEVLRVAGVDVRVLHTPGHAPGAVCLHVPELGVVFTGDTLFQGGPGATGRSYSDFPTIVSSIRDVLLPLPPETVVHTGHGADTTIGAEAPHLDEWLRRGH
ncbi:MBL fold metallo-hydrolase [Sphaerimonospora thailandensis]|uniref:Hydrolase n=1 Tax=Sphaerimonospora thailandensis TaxID=795644 RepID=A0A8J3VWK6_9ACTN|nr:MBL fold metallo-hydrolase [Sphaerimonospora thailandensis]GIH67894.1 hydrolase [Sphaerimonospora thailandensis]